jgi:DsbC/DsbD-like thiol-disulfide interchange protein
VALRVLQMLWRRSGEIAYRDQANGLIGRFAAVLERQPSAYAYLLTGVDDLRHGELSERGYAAQGGIHLQAQLQPLSDGKHLMQLSIRIPEGWHINADRPLSDDLIGTHVQLGKEDRGWRLAPVTYPEARLERLAFSSKPLALYTGQIQLQALVEQTDGAAPPTTLRIQVGLQACNQEICLPPDRIDLWLSPSV